MYNTLNYFRETYRIPANIKLQWGLIKEVSLKGEEIRLGVILKGSAVFIDVAERRLRSRCDFLCVKREIYPAIRIRQDKQSYCFKAETENGPVAKIFATDYIAHVMAATVYTPALEKNRPL